MSDLTEFLLARIAEDEAAALECGGEAWDLSNGNGLPMSRRGPIGAPDYFVDSGPTLVAHPHSDAHAAHIAIHDPARVLAECDAKRQVVEKAQRAEAAYERQVVPATAVAASVLSHVLSALARPYADHPDYCEEWRP